MSESERVENNTNGDAATVSENMPVKLGATKAAIGKLRKKFKTVPDVTTKDGYADCKSTLSELVPIRTGIEKKRKQLVSDAVSWQKKVNAEAKELTALVAEIEKPFADAKKAQDEKVEREKQEAAEKEEKRIAAIEEKIESFQAIPGAMLGATAKVLQDNLEDLEAAVITTGEYMEFVEPASLVLDQVKGQLRTALAGQEALEKQQADLKEQQDALAKQQAENNARAKELEEKEQAAEQDRLAKQAEEDEARRLKEEGEQDKKKQAELDARLPEDIKLRAYIDALVAVEKPEIKNLYLSQLLDDVSETVEHLQHNIHKYTQAPEQE